MWPPLSEGHLHCKFGAIWDQASQSYRCVKIASLLLLLIYSLCLSTPHFLGLHDTLSCVLKLLILSNCSMKHFSIHIIAAISWPPALISQPGFKDCIFLKLCCFLVDFTYFHIFCSLIAQFFFYKATITINDLFYHGQWFYYIE